MKKILNDPQNYVDEMLDGLVAAHPEIYSKPAHRIIVRSGERTKGKVGIVTGGGSGHLPVFTGYVGTGLLDGCAIGNVFASPSADQMAETIRAVDAGAGVLCLYGNYGGDVMNFDMAAEMVSFEDDIRTASHAVSDDVASASRDEMEKRRGVAGMIYAFKIAGAAAERMADLDEVARLAKKASDNVVSMGMAMTPCIIPQLGKPSSVIGEDEMEMGMGIHGEPGTWRGPIKPADDILDEMFDTLQADRPLAMGDRVSVLVNSLGATPHEELYILYRRLAGRLSEIGVEVVMPLVGRYATSMEMTGASLSILKLDEELEDLLLAPANCAFWKV
ncbi:dihydroxyacetone kinase subunit DhaK [Nitratireductor aquimarinus]|uniref:dihydroxyacetone kinase subunit DhaK n=1 Tax=Nitratireductor TaxID=245876 RepID=UPI0019D35675|nr:MULTISPECIES: dihydroxyacetone kinase subunit DhaK [Nitratireductor]MBN7776537.1 dihydroxyacetone kinase subunit DhaK [Nitratireductor pacificus]MBN7779404.1 dihydroxyacetone kinase subunit DhaK [Nitratireductor pacificus]MBN7788211.1 dihydroxyacetone kinase subunit DhaK [Nitratireductor aquimarinus]MBY6098258.1 dihydroxyacetone kinase subunit DhaK [Nitratireductor aquimarinus]MCA1259237.1 dihydroxyacetone kinase subunit DhaK [Nitratireductor aquimarinus]